MRAHYPKGFVWLHWVIATLVMMLLSVSFFLDGLDKSIRPTAIFLHKSFGLSILFLMLLRLLWRAKILPPPLPPITPRWEVFLARGVQAAMYFFLIVMASVGWVMSVLADHTPSFFGLFQLPLPWIKPNPALSKLFFLAHQTIAWILIGLISLHVMGALKHVIIDRDKVLESMLP